MEWGLNTVPSAPRLALKSLGARWQAGERVGCMGEQVRQCALRARSDCERGSCTLHAQNAQFLPRMARVSPTRRARDVRVAVRAGCGSGATPYASPRVGAALR